MRTFNEIEIYRILKNNGWKLHHKTGGHAIYKNDKGEHISIGTGKCNKMIMQRLIKQYKLAI